MKILYVTATAAEAQALLSVKDIVSLNGIFKHNTHEIHLLIAGIGSVSTLWNMVHWISEHGKPELAINGGIAGSFSDSLRIGDVVMPVSECFADLGIEDKSDFFTLAEAGLADPAEPPFINGWIRGDDEIISHMAFLKSVRSITINTATGSESTIHRLIDKFNPDIETMEGASFFYLCRRENIPFLGIRAISNKIEPRNRDSWEIKLAIDKLATSLYKVFKILELKQ